MKPILFNTEMVRAILEGRKTVTRRVVKPQPPATSVVRKRSCAWDWSFWADCDMGHLMKPPYHPGDILWVRETWAKSMAGTFMYRADDKAIMVGRWHPSIHMPKEAARLFLRVTDVRVEMKNDRVLVYRPEMKESDVGAVSVQFGWNCSRKKTDITHWMPLPEPPKEIDHETD